MMRGRFGGLKSNSHIYFDPVYIIVYYISLDNQKKEVLGNISYMKIGTEIENCFFNFYFLIQDISFDNMFPSLHFLTHLENIHLEGTVSQIFDTGPSFHLMKCRKIIMKND